MPDVNAHFVQLQSNIIARLQATEAKDFEQKAVPWPVSANGKTIPVLSETFGDLESQVSNSLAGYGICLIVLTPTADGFNPDAPSLAMNAPVVVQIQENVAFNQAPNGTKVAALALVAFVMKRLQWWPHGLYAGSPRAQLVKLQARPFLLVTDSPELTYNVAANAPINLNATLAA